MNAGEPIERDPPVNAFGTTVHHDADGWSVRAMIDGEWRVISRHASEELARAAVRDLNASANPPTERCGAEGG